MFIAPWLEETAEHELPQSIDIKLWIILCMCMCLCM
jgi:hypothetical protein